MDYGIANARKSDWLALCVLPKDIVSELKIFKFF